MRKLILAVGLWLLLPVVIKAQLGDGPVSHVDFTVNANQGQPSITFADDPGTEWLQIWIGTPGPEWREIHRHWYQHDEASCDGETCVLYPEVYPPSGEYVVYLQPYGQGRYYNSNPRYWAGPKTLSINFAPPAIVTNMSVSQQGNRYTFSWQASSHATWYQLWVGKENPLDTRLMEWFSAYGIGCGDLGICAVTRTINLTFGKTYTWYVQAWGPGGYSTGGISGWAAGPSITIGAGFQPFALGGHVDSGSQPAVMHSAGMTWIKRQLYFDYGQSLDYAQAFIQNADDNEFYLLLSVIGNKSNLGANRSQFIAAYAEFLGQVAAEMGTVGAIEVWNEPNIDAEWPNGQISGEAYTEMLHAAYNAIKAANPNIMVISAAPAPTGANISGAVISDDNFIGQMANAGAEQYLDCVGIHYNEGVVSPTQSSGDPRGNSTHYSRYYSTMVALYSSVFPSSPLCFTELGYLSAEGYGALPSSFAWAEDTSIAEQAQWLGEAAGLSRADTRIRFMFVWNVDFTRWGGDDVAAGYAIIRQDGNCPACASLAAAMSP